MSDKTDKATVFEFAARYVHFLKGFVGNQHDKVIKSALHVILTWSNQTLFYNLYHYMSIWNQLSHFFPLQ